MGLRALNDSVSIIFQGACDRVAAPNVLRNSAVLRLPVVYPGIVKSHTWLETA